MSTSITTVVIGAGQAGLAMSRCLTDRSIDHVVLERGSVANSWRTERWDSLRLLTPNWMTRLPGHRYGGTDPDGYMTAGETADFLTGYGTSFDAPVLTEAAVDSVTPRGDGRIAVASTVGHFTARSVVLATGACSKPRIPAMANLLPGNVQQLPAIGYRNPGQIGPGRILVVGASASGAQIADELAAAGRDVTLACGHHVRLPRTYRGRDIHWWMDRIGVLDERYDEVEDIVKARRTPSLQLVGSPEKRTIDLGALMSRGVQPVGRLAAVTDSRVQFSGSLANAITSADLKLGRLLDRIDHHVSANGMESIVGEADRPGPTPQPDAALDLSLADLGAVIWATGFAPNHPYLPTELVDRKGAVIHDGGVMPTPGMYLLGMPFLRRRKSAFIDGVGADAVELAQHLQGQLSGQGAPVAA